MGTDPTHHRWTTAGMLNLWDPDERTSIEHQIWIAALKADTQIRNLNSHQRELAIENYQATASLFETNSQYREIYNAQVAGAEHRTGHDLKARLEVFDNESGGHGLIHLGMTSSDITELTWQILTRRATEQIQWTAAAVLHQLTTLITTTQDLPVCAYTHGLPAQPTLLGKRFADTADALRTAYLALAGTQHLPLRGIAGAVGNSSDLLSAGYDPTDIGQLNDHIVHALEIPHGAPAITGQQYPRHLDHTVAAALLDLVSPVVHLMQSIRVMVVLGQAVETPTPGQVGSSAMPHKRNPRFAERACGLAAVIRGYMAMLGEAGSSQWFEGDVSNSAVRRVALPGVFCAADGLLNTAHRVLSRLQVNRSVLTFELHRWAPYLCTGQYITEAVTEFGLSREKAHEIVRQHAQAALSQLDGGDGETLLHRLDSDPAWPLIQRSMQAVAAALGDPTDPIYEVAREQCEQAMTAAQQIVACHYGSDTHIAEVM